jgi:NitT/TauT family transport system substrate-binding protein
MNSWIFDGLSRREFMKKAALTGTAAYLGIGGDYGIAAVEPPPETTTIRIRQWRPSCWAPIHVAEPLLYEEGFTDVQYVNAPGPEYPELLKDAAVDLSPDFVALAMHNIDKQKKLPVKLLAGLHVGCYALVGSERVNSVRDLKGKTVWVGSVKHNGPHIFFSAIVAYVGLDPRTDINYAWVKKDEAMQLFKEGKIDAFMSFPPGPQELMAKGVGRLLVDTNVDKPWSQYFCCMISGQSDFVKNNPIATRRALRAILKANDIVARDPQHTLSILQKKKIWKKSETKYILQALREIPYGKWREYSPEDTLRFYALRLHNVGIIKTPPDEFIAQYTDWSFLRSMKSELGLKYYGI